MRTMIKGSKLAKRFDNDTRSGDRIKGAGVVEVTGQLSLPHGNVKVLVKPAGRAQFKGYVEGVPTYTYTSGDGEKNVFTVTRPDIRKPYKGLPAKYYSDFCVAITFKG